MKRYEIACYHWSNWHPYAVNDIKRGKGWTEWEYVKAAIPRLVGHQQPKIPLWGYLDDSQPETMALQIDAAADHGIDAFIFDWSWRKDRNVGGWGNQICLEQGFLHAENRMRIKFGLMLCGDFFVDDADKLYDYLIENYFSQPNYWIVEGGCYFSIYEIFKFIKAFGSIEAAAKSIKGFRNKAAAKGFKIHLVLIEWGLQDSQTDILGPDIDALLKILGADAVTSYVWAHNTTPAWPAGSYEEWANEAMKFWSIFERKFSVPYYPHVSMGWDPSPRCPNNMFYEEGGPLMYHTIDGKKEILHQPYFTSIITENTPEQFEQALIKAKEYVNDKSQSEGKKIITLYAWNEWSEGGYLEPEVQYGYGYLEAIKKVFK